MIALHLFDAAVTRECDRCPDVIRAGDLAVWLPLSDELVCVMCADEAEHATASVST